MSLMRALVMRVWCLLAMVPLSSVHFADESLPVRNPAERNQGDAVRDLIRLLKPLSGWVGDWRGVVQPRRGSSAGAWTEKATVFWDISESHQELVLALDPGRDIRRLRLTMDKSTQGLVAILEHADGGESRMPGGIVVMEEKNTAAGPSSAGAAGAMIFTTEAGESHQRRVTIRNLGVNRVTVLSEERLEGATNWKRVAEYGLTRAGTRLAAAGNGEQQCLVTGGLGSIPVTFEGATYFVCCEGCRQVFNDDPRAALGAYRQRLKDEVGNR